MNTEKTEDFPHFCKCALCLDYMYEPRSLSCGHTFCLGCKTSIEKKCPNCMKDIKGITINYQLRDMLIDFYPEEYYKRVSKFYEEQKEKTLTKE